MSESTKTVATDNDLTDEAFWTQRWNDTKRRKRLQWLRDWIRNRSSRHTRRLYARLLGLAGGGPLDVLEIGCAPGAQLQLLHEACPNARLHGIDYSKSGLEITKAKLQELDVPATLHHGDAFSAVLPQQYDVVCSFGVIEHFNDPLPLVRRHGELCKNGGLVIIAVPNCSSYVPRRLLELFDPDTLAVHNLDVMSTKGLRRVLESAGFFDVQAGRSGPPRLHEYARPGARLRRAYLLAAKIWNLIVFVLPFPRLWGCDFWAVGYVHGDRS